MTIALRHIKYTATTLTKEENHEKTKDRFVIVFKFQPDMTNLIFHRSIENSNDVNLVTKPQ